MGLSMKHDREYVLKLAYERKVKFIRLWFSDILGQLKSFAITIDEFEDALIEGVRFDGSTLKAFARSDEEELIALPDPSTFQILPWRPSEDAVARIFCDICSNNLSPFPGDPRYILKRNLLKAADSGFTFYTGPEIEFFFFENSQSPKTIDRGGYFDLTPLDIASDYRRQTVLTLEQMGIDVLSSHHEGAHSQHEIDLRHEDALTTADNIVTFRIAAKEIAQRNGIYASFMPKPLSDQNGSGMHVHLSLFDNDDHNLFFDATNEYNLSEIGKAFTAGLIHHADEFFAVTNQWINSYKRFSRGFEAPLRFSWSVNDNSSLIRIPKCRTDKPNSMRVELRNPDPACNPYLAFSAILAAGLAGIENKYSLQDCNAESKSIPHDLSRALDLFESSELMKKTFGTEIHQLFIENKRVDIERFHNHVTDFEISQYLPIL